MSNPRFRRARRRRSGDQSLRASQPDQPRENAGRGHANLPDDPADACRAILRSLLPLTDFARQELPGQFAHLVNVLASFEANDTEAWEWSRHALAIVARKAEDDAGAQIAAIDRALDLARHADPAHHERDERISEGLTPYAPSDDAKEAS